MNTDQIQVKYNHSDFYFTIKTPKYNKFRMPADANMSCEGLLRFIYDEEETFCLRRQRYYLDGYSNSEGEWYLKYDDDYQTYTFNKKEALVLARKMIKVYDRIKCEFIYSNERHIMNVKMTAPSGCLLSFNALIATRELLDIYKEIIEACIYNRNIKLYSFEIYNKQVIFGTGKTSFGLPSYLGYCIFSELFELNAN